MIFEVSFEQIEQLDSFTLVDLMRRLLLAEARKTEVELSCVSVPLQISVPDGGEDGRIEWTPGAEHTDFFPSSFCILQSKATRLGPAALKAEIWKKGTGRRGKPAVLNDAAREVWDRHGSYILFTSAPMTGRMVADGEAAIRAGFDEAGRDSSRCAAIRIYDSNKIANWVNTHPSVSVWVHEVLSGRQLNGFQSLAQWAKSPDIQRSAWVDDGIGRYLTADLSVPPNELRNVGSSTLPFTEITARVFEHLAEPQRIVRVVGASGFGKSRFVYELFTASKEPAQLIDANAVIYVDYRDVGDELNRLALDMANEGSEAILIVDECPDAIHRRLAETVSRAGSSLRLVTIDVETRVQTSAQVMVIRLEPASDAIIQQIAKQVGNRLPDTDVGFVRRLAEGFPRMAVAAAEALNENRDPITTVDELVDRIVWGREPKDTEAERALEFASLFDVLGIDDRACGDLEFVATRIVHLSTEIMYEHLMRFKPRGIMLHRGDYIQVQPVPLAARLAARRLSLLTPEQRSALTVEAPAALRLRFLDRLRWLDTSEHARVIAHTLLAEDMLGNIAALNTDFGAKCLDRLAHVNPDLTMATIDRVFGPLSADELMAVGSGRRHLVWALEKLVFRRASFGPAARLLLRLAGAEVEEKISNNATGQFKQLFRLHLSGTEAEPALRLQVLDEGLQSPDEQLQSVCVDALEEMLNRNFFRRSGGSDTIGSRAPLRDWCPAFWSEVFDFHRQALHRLTAIACSKGPIAARARDHLGSHIRTLLCPNLFDDVRTMINQIQARFGFWPEAIIGTNSWLYFDRKQADPAFARQVRDLFDQLLPSDPVELAILYTRGWLIDLHDPDTDYDNQDSGANDHTYAIRQAKALASTIATDPVLTDRCLTRMMHAELNSTSAFAQFLAELVEEPVALFARAIQIGESRDAPVNLGIFAGLIIGTDNRDPVKSRECIKLALQSPTLKKDAVQLIGCRRLQESDLATVADLLRSGDVEPVNCIPLSYGQGLDHFSPEAIAHFFEVLGSFGAPGLWSTLDMLNMYRHGRDEFPEVLVDTSRTILANPRLLDQTNRSGLDGYLLARFYKRLDNLGYVDEAFARAMMRQVLSLPEASSDVYFSLDDAMKTVLESLVKHFPSIVWQETEYTLTNHSTSYTLDWLFEPDKEDHNSAGPLFGLPVDLYLDWARQEPKERLRFVVGWLPMIERLENGKLIWHPIVEQITAEFGDDPDILNEISARFQPRSWSGSIIPHLTPYLPLLESWFNHPKATVRSWARDKHQRLQDYIDRERRRDDEHDLGIY